MDTPDLNGVIRLVRFSSVASNRTLRPLGLETFSFWCARRIFDRHPEWLANAKPTDSERQGLNVRTLTIEIPSENPRVPEPLTIAVEVDRIIVVSWLKRGDSPRWHQDFTSYFLGERSDDPTGLDTIIHFVEQFLDEEIAAYWTEEGPGECSTFGMVTAEQVRSNTFVRGSRTEIRSWRGSLDQSL